MATLIVWGGRVLLSIGGYELARTIGGWFGRDTRPASPPGPGSINWMLIAGVVGAGVMYWHTSQSRGYRRG